MNQPEAEALADASAFPLGADSRTNRRFLLDVVGLVLLIVALSQPRWGFQLRPTSLPPDVLWLIIDVGPTMRCRDLPGGRGDFAKSVADSLVAKWNGKVRVSIFADRAELVSPSTTDDRRSRQVIERLGFDSIRSSRSSMQAVLEHVAQDDVGEAYFGVVLSDGGGSDPDRRLTQSKSTGDWIVLGLGDPSAPSPVPSPDGGWPIERNTSAESKRNDPALNRLTKSLRGRFLPAWPDADAVANRIVLEARSIDTEVQGSNVIPREQFQWFAAAALALLVRPWNWRIGSPAKATSALFLMTCGSSFAQEGVSYRSARSKLESGRFAEARVEFEALIQRGQLIGWSQWGNGVAIASQVATIDETAKRRELFAAAIRSFREAATAIDDPSEKVVVLTNLGVVKRMLAESKAADRASSDKHEGKTNNDLSSPTGSQSTDFEANPKVEKRSGTEIGGGSVERPVAGLSSSDPGPLPRAEAEAMLDAVVRKSELADRTQRPTRPKQ